MTSNITQGSMDDKKRELKKRWKKAERDAARSAFPLHDDKLEALFDAVEMALEDAGCDHSLRATTEWLSANGVDIGAVVVWLENNGGFCVSLRRAGLTFPKHYQPGAPKVTKRK